MSSMWRRPKQYRPRGIIRHFFHYLAMKNENDQIEILTKQLEKKKAEGIGESEETLIMVLIERGLSKSQAQDLIRQSKRQTFNPQYFRENKKISPSSKFYKSKDGAGTLKKGSYSSFQGGSPGLGKGKS
jgi:hypothetical protein